MRGFDFSPLYRSTVGFDQLQSLLDSVTQDTSPTYPPYNIERTSENDYRITVAVAGFGQDDLDIEVKQNVLTISGKRAEPEETNYLYRGIAASSLPIMSRCKAPISRTGSFMWTSCGACPKR